MSGLRLRAGSGLKYGAKKKSWRRHAFKTLADSLREEVNTEGIRVTSIFAGRTATPRIESLHGSENYPYQPELLLQSADVASVVVNALSLPWSAEVSNITIRPMRKSSGP